ncbi:conserved hypothetical protein [Thioalkalivibrio sulfidiphilus HL-EbGr7]|uniref:DUF5655 domain-containing protein n=1 Tax=Thioalkalivibrio sulfidiphilus (strain HL-EbGR7) TaxID=396588 RepID=B8GLU4_THISH|nr:DUF5655 domain-containing protein [Thioalkalivibrio sulfidiphilus]ACL71697.1 conserved hypothetical protein [Thioalkalivibrio sulfidiphilus HL-EbGr7]
MTDIKLFRTQGQTAQEIPGSAVALEKSLQALMEQNLDALLGVTFLASEYSTGPRHGGRIDTLGMDENGCPVIIEYKRATNENVINQGLFYLDWLMDHRAEFQLLVQKQLGTQQADQIDWSAPRLLCIAGGFSKYDEHAVQQMNRNIELIRYKRFGDDLLLLELMNAVSAKPAADTKPQGTAASVNSYKTISDTLAGLQGPLLDLFEALRAHLLALGDDVQEKTLRFYVAFKRIKNFACVEVKPSKGTVQIYLKVNPDDIELEEGFSRDVRNIGHFGTGDLEVTLASPADLEKARALIQASYDAN